MKVSQEIMSKTDHRRQPQVQDQTQHFEKVMETQTTRLHQRELQGLVEDITKQGKKLAKFRSFQDLAKFKRMIKRFLQKAVYDGLSIHQERSFNNQGMNRFTTVKELDEKLVALTEDLMDQEKSTVDLLGIIGEIRGLLINVYT